MKGHQDIKTIYKEHPIEVQLNIYTDWDIGKFQKEYRKRTNLSQKYSSCQENLIFRNETIMSNYK